jgi:hypothetical protein
MEKKQIFLPDFISLLFVYVLYQTQMTKSKYPKNFSY